MGVSLNGGTPISHPKMMIFSRKTYFLVGTTIFGNPHGTGIFTYTFTYMFPMFLIGELPYIPGMLTG